jgi:hypothetical protein
LLNVYRVCVEIEFSENAGLGPRHSSDVRAKLSGQIFGSCFHAELGIYNQKAKERSPMDGWPMIGIFVFYACRPLKPL